MKKFEIGKKYKFVSWVPYTLDVEIGDIFTCNSIDKDGDAWSREVTAFGGIADISDGWCCAGEEHLDDGRVTEVLE